MESARDHSGASDASIEVDPVSPRWFEAERIKELKEQFDASRPYTHVVLPQLCSQSVLLKARGELIDNVVAKYKETDLFKVHASIILGASYLIERSRHIVGRSEYVGHQLFLAGIPDRRFGEYGWSGV